MRWFSVVFALLAFELVAGARVFGGIAWLALWPALALLIVALAHFVERPGAFGKVGHRLSFVSSCLLLPYLAVQHAFWHLFRVISREPPFARLEDDILIGRRLLAHEYPRTLASIVDLTCEFSECLPRDTSLRYVNIPLLDGGSLEPAALDSALAPIHSLPRPLYVHCAQGHGRTCMIAVCLLIALRRASSVADSMARVRAVRPRARMNRRQRDSVEQFCCRARSR